MFEGHSAGAALQNRNAHVLMGIVSAVDSGNHAVKVRIQPDDVETGWLPDVCGVQAGDLRVSCPSVVGAHVVLLPLEGDGENFVVVGSVYDTVVGVPVSPVTGKAVGAGELLIRAGCGMPSAVGGVGAPEHEGAGWCQVGRAGVVFGAGDARVTIGAGRIVFAVGGVEAVLSGQGLHLSGGDVTVGSHSLTGHVHPAGAQMTGKPVG